MGTASQGVNVRLGGYFGFIGFIVDDTADKQSLPAGDRVLGRRAQDFYYEAELHVLVDGKAANGLTYGMEIQFQMDGMQAGATGANNTGQLGNGTGINLDEAYVYISGRAGTIKVGDEDSAANLLQVRTPGITGLDRDSFWDEPLVGGSPSRFTSINDGSDATKISYLSPQFFGFDFGVSYAPNSGEGESPALDPVVTGQRDRTGLQDEISAGVRWRGTVGGVGLATSAGLQNAGAPQRTAAGGAVNAQQVTAYALGATATAMGFTLGGEYVWGQYQGVSVGRSALGAGREDSYHWNVALAYRIPAGMRGLGGVQLLGFYGEAEQDINPVGFDKYKQTAWGLGAAYPIAPGLIGYANYTRMEEENSAQFAGNLPGARNDRDANIIGVGVRLAF
jgi:predicted porin